jgi:hypothetical protein
LCCTLCGCTSMYIITLCLLRHVFVDVWWCFYNISLLQIKFIQGIDTQATELSLQLLLVSMLFYASVLAV